jgi:tRNA nucleotidyltransferase/poly(A) polymerase
MRSFNKLYKELMEVWSPEYKIQIPKKDKDSGFCEYNPKINKFSFESPDKMFIVVAFVMFTMQTSWYNVVEQFPEFIKWFFENALKNKKIVSNINPPGTGHMIMSPKKSVGGPSDKLSYVFEAWTNRKKIYDKLGEYRNDPVEMYIWILENIKGLGMPKAGFLVQLITGRLGCVDSINSKIYGTEIKTGVSGNLRSTGNMEKIINYITFSDPISKILWDDWCEIVARKTDFNLPDPGSKGKQKPENMNITTIDKNDNRVAQTPYFRNRGNTERLKREIKRLGLDKKLGKGNIHKKISADHFNLLKDTEKYLESFNHRYKMLMKEYVEDFDQKWDKAVSESEELQVALDLMKNIKAKLKGEIYIVGGVPRDLLMGNAIDDVDLATNIPVEQLEKHFELRNISKNDSQPVYAILWKGYVYDLAKFRTDSGDIGRQANVSTETDSFQADTERRDLTINSFGLDENGKIVDYQGGLDDLKNKIVRAVGDAKKRFLEDATRILRVFRFAAKMDFEIEENTKKAAIELKYLLQDPKAISKESISKEFYKSAKTGRTLAKFLKKLQDTKILHDILPEFTEMEGFDHDPQHHPEGDSQVLGHIYECLNASPYKDPIINLAVLFHDFGKATTRGKKDNGFSSYHGHEAAGVPIVEGIFERLKFNELSQQDKKNILAAVDKHMLVHNLDKLNIKTLTRLIQNPAWETIKAVGYCDEASRGSGLFNEKEFWDKIKRAEEKVSKIGGSEDETRKRLKQYFSGNKLMEWFPVLIKDKSKFKDITAALQEYTLEELNAGREPDDTEMKTIVAGILKKNQFNEWYNYYQKN